MLTAALFSFGEERLKRSFCAHALDFSVRVFQFFSRDEGPAGVSIAPLLSRRSERVEVGFSLQHFVKGYQSATRLQTSLAHALF